MADDEQLESMVILGRLDGHSDQVTCLKTSLERPDLLLSGSRGMLFD